jgi:hypothetical protein
MISEWMKVMLGEISRKKAEAEQERIEELRRRAEDADFKAQPPGRAASRSNE